MVNAVRLGVLSVMVVAGPAVARAEAQSPIPCVPGDHVHRVYRTQDTLHVVPNGTSAPTVYIGIEHKGIYKSTDGGATWARRVAGIRSLPRQGSESEPCIGELGRIATDPNNREHVYLLTVNSPGPLGGSGSPFGGIYRSTDGAATWTQLTGYGSEGGGHGLAVVGGSTAATVFMGVGNSPASYGGAQPGFFSTTGVVYRSTNAGSSWTELDQRATPGTGLIDDYLGAAQVYVDATGLKVWVPAYVRSSTGAMGNNSTQIGYLESADGGNTWFRGTTRIPDASGRASLNGDIAPANFDHRMLSSTNTPTTEGGSGLAMSWYTLDGGTSWAATSRYVYVGRYSPHDPSGNTLYGYDPFSGPRGTPGQGILKSIDGGATWSVISELPPGVNNDFDGVRVSAFAFHPTNDQIIYASGTMGYVWRSIDGGATWSTLLNLDSPVVGGLNTTTPAAPGAPGAPTGLYTGVAGETAWTVPVQGGLATSWVVQTATNAAFTTGLVDFPVATATQLTRSIGFGTTFAPARYVRVVAVNSVGSSLPSPVTPFFALSPRRVDFGATKAGAGGALVSVTAPQSVTFPWGGSGAPAWTASVDVPWAQVSGGSGTGAGQFTVSVINPGNVIGGSTTLGGNVIVTVPSLGTSSRIPLQLSIQQVTNTSLPAFGQVDSPVQNATDVVGAIGVTGWAIDDVGVASVKIYRSCLGIDNPLSCQTILGQSLVYVGDGAFLPGARPDVETAFSGYPNANAAGWGMQILTNMLPHIPNGQLYGGQGALTLYVYATDQEGHVTLLGRSADPNSPDYGTPTSVTMANDSIAKPFGTIDTPLLGSTISGTIANFGWVLTPDTNITPAEPSDILMATNGSGMVVYVDGIATATVAYNQCRGTAGNPPPPGAFCNDDIANIFGNPTPQPSLTTRTSNPTRYRNLDATRSAIGAYVLNTTLLSNGRHQIAWGVADSAARGEGIGSRFFTVLNSGADAAQRDADRMPASALAGRTPAREGIRGRTGYGLEHPWISIRAGTDGSFSVRLPESGRLELWFGAALTAGYLIVNDELRPLPVGATLDGAYFAWMPPIGYMGTYHLVFAGGDERIDVRVTVAPIAPTRAGEPEIRMDLVTPVQSAGCSVPSAQCAMKMEGWAFDPQATIGAGIGAVHIWANRVGPEVQGSRSPGVQGGASPAFLGEAVLDDAAFRLDAHLAPGVYDITAYAWNVRTARWEDARTARVTVR